MADSPSAGPPAEPARTRRHRSELTPREILDAIRRWHDLYGEPPGMTDWDPYRARQAGQEWRAERYAAGDWPSVKSVRNHFGRLSAAVAAAGLVPRHQGQRRVRQELALDEGTLLHLAHLRAMQGPQAPPDSVAAALRNVARARTSDDPSDLRGALVELAAAALAWARHIDEPLALLDRFADGDAVEAAGTRGS